MMIRPSSMPTGMSASGRISHESLRQTGCRAWSFECDVAHHGMLDTVRLDLQLVVPMPQRLREERSPGSPPTGRTVGLLRCGLAGESWYWRRCRTGVDADPDQPTVKAGRGRMWFCRTCTFWPTAMPDRPDRRNSRSRVTGRQTREFVGPVVTAPPTRNPESVPARTFGSRAFRVVRAHRGIAAGGRSVTLIIVDARTDLAAGAGPCRCWHHRRAVPVVAVVNEGGLVAVNVDWGIGEILLRYQTRGRSTPGCGLLVSRSRRPGQPGKRAKVNLREPISTRAPLRGCAAARLTSPTKSSSCLKYLAQHAGQVFKANCCRRFWGYGLLRRYPHGGRARVCARNWDPSNEALIGNRSQRRLAKAVRPARGRPGTADGGTTAELVDDRRCRPRSANDGPALAKALSAGERYEVRRSSLPRTV